MSTKAGQSQSPANIMVSYLEDVPSAHREQAQSWGLTGPAGRALRSLLSHPPATNEVGPLSEAASASKPDLLSGYDRSASIVLTTSFALARNSPGIKRTIVASETLLAAFTESQSRIAAADAAEVAVLRGMLRADEPGGTFAIERTRLFGTPADLLDHTAEQDSSFPPLTRNLRAILDTARTIAVRVSRGADVAVRHLLVALISDTDGSDRASVAAEIMARCGVSLNRLREALVRVIRDRHPEDDPMGWRHLLLGSDVRTVATARPDTIPEDPREEDALELRRYSDALGALICAERQRPPLSIAVFGPWGSGKSFFMGMIRAAVAEARDTGAREFAAGRLTPFLRRVVQIKFNAWHYAEGNLWASLVYAILAALQDELAPTEATPSFESVLATLRIRQAAQQDAEVALQAAEQRLAEKKAAQEVAAAAADERRQKEADLPSVGDVVRELQEEALARLKPPGDRADADAWIRSVGDSVTKAASYLGRPDLADQVVELQRASTDAAAASAALKVKVGDIQELLEEAKASAGRGWSLLSWLANARISRGDRVFLAGSAGILLVALLLMAAIFAGWGAKAAAAISAAAAFVTPLLGTLAVALAWARRHIADANRAFAILGSLRTRVEARSAERLAGRDAALAAARRATAEASAEAERRLAEVEAARVAVKKAQADLDEASSPERLKQFVAQRLADGDYQRSLGLIHTIRSDLDRLQRMLLRIPSATPGGTEAPVQRIVLYIDDLDRCPPNRVVEVLEAVHLLLAFELFVVVVGVDVRWVAQALRKRYPLQLGDAPGIASPTDYLEKVFQIPFWLPRMNAAAGRRLLEGAIGDIGVETLQPAARGKAVNSTRPGVDAAQTQLNDPEPDDATETSGDEAEATTSSAPSSPTITAKALLLGAQERQRLLDMAGSIGASPRRAKRFVNLYRLLKASLSPAERRGFVLDGGKGGNYPGALALLAAATAAPASTRALLVALAEGEVTDADAHLEKCLQLASVNAGPSERAALATLGREAAEADDKAQFVRNLQAWAPGVARFLFDAG